MLGVDPGSRATGYGVVEADGSRLRCVACGVIRPAEGPLEARLGQIHHALGEVLRRYEPTHVGFEAIFAARNLRSAIVLGQARGAALAVCGLAGAVVHEYTPSEVKSAVVGQGRASKQQVQHMVRLLLGLERAPASDASDALAVAICHLQRAPLRAAIDAAEHRSWASLPSPASSVATRRPVP